MTRHLSAKWPIHFCIVFLLALIWLIFANELEPLTRLPEAIRNRHRLSEMSIFLPRLGMYVAVHFIPPMGYLFFTSALVYFSHSKKMVRAIHTYCSMASAAVLALVFASI